MPNYIEREEGGPGPTFGSEPSAHVITPPSQPVEAGGMWRRFLAMLLDSIILWFLVWPLKFLQIGTLFALRPETLASAGVPRAFVYVETLSGVIGLVVFFFYFGWFYKNKGATPGKMVLGLQVVDANDGSYLGYWRSFFRETLGKAISWGTFCISFIVGGVRPDKKTFHDFLFGTQVIHRK